MRVEQRFFPAQTYFVVLIMSLLLSGAGSAQAGKPVTMAEGDLVFALADGWAESELNAGDVLAGFATQDKRSSLFFQQLSGAVGGSMQDLMDNTIANFAERFEVAKEGEAKTGQVQGPGRKWPAIYNTIEATVPGGKKSFEMKFYLLVFDTGDHLYFMQASTTLPVRISREGQILEMIRSIVAKS